MYRYPYKFKVFWCIMIKVVEKLGGNFVMFEQITVIIK